MLFPRNGRWDKSTEVVVVGYGLAGAVAAISAHDLGASVMILEKQSADSHCSCSSMSRGLFLSPSDVERATEYMVALCQVDEPETNWTDLETIQAWAKYSVQNKGWVENLGGKVKFFAKGGELPQFPGSDSMEAWQYQGAGRRLMQFMYDQVKSRKIDVCYQTPAQRLLTDETGCVIGVKATDICSGQPKEVNIMASRAVILCSGGFEENEAMKLQYLRVYPIYFAGNIGNTGDGIRMAQEVGAELWHMNCAAARLVAKFPDFPIAFFIDYSGGGKSAWKQDQVLTTERKSPAGFIFVDKYGQRYMNEDINPHAASYELTPFDSHKLEYPRVPSYHIFDRRRIERSPLGQTTSGASGPKQLYKWSRDNSVELQKGWITQGETVAELAARIGVAPENLENTVRLWNRQCEVGQDSNFNRNPLELVPLDRPPFYALKLFPGGSNTQGGPRRNSRAQVVTPFGTPIPGLYVAGECGSVYGLLYPASGGNLGECIAFGRIAAENAMRESVKK